MNDQDTRDQTTRQQKRPVPPEIYNAFIATLRLQRVRMVDAHINADEARPSPSNTTVRFDYNARYQNDDDGFEAFASYKASFTNTQTDKPQGDVAATFALRFESGEPMTDDIFTVFGQVNLKVNTWPFMREFLQSSLNRLDWPAFALPLLRPEGRPRRETATPAKKGS